MISAINNHKVSNPSFGCPKKATKVVEMAEELGPQLKPRINNTVKKIFTDLIEVVDTKWTKYRKSKSYAIGTYPEFSPQKVGKDKKVRLRLFNNPTEKYILDVEKGDGIERVVINRNKPEQFVYEKIVKTENGSYGTKTFNSTRQNDDEVTAKVFDMYEQYLPLFSGPKRKN